MIIGIDMGGTHLDGVLLKEGKMVQTVKNPTIEGDLFGTVWQGLQQLMEGQNPADVARIQLSTTVSTNAIVEDAVPPVGVMVQAGPGMAPPFDDDFTFLEYLDGSMDHRGEAVQNLNDAQLADVAAAFKKAGLGNVAVVTKFSTRNPLFEKEIQRKLAGDFSHITMGHTLSGKLNFPRRVQTAYLNAAVHGTFNHFAKGIEQSLKREGVSAPVYVLKADGGTMTLAAAKEKPVETLLSGPAASFMGLTALVDTDEDAVLLDVGGTTTDIFFLVDGAPVFEPMGITVAGHPTLVRAIYSHSIGIGGDSHVRLQDGALKIGPQRLGRPVAFGGDALTPTDAMVALSLLEAPHHGAAEDAVTALADDMGTTPADAADRILDTVTDTIWQTVERLLQRLNNHPVYTVKELLQDRAVKPVAVYMVGGPAAVLAERLKQKITQRVHCPPHYAIANAVGAALAKPTFEINLVADTERQTLSVPEVALYETISPGCTLADAEEYARQLVKENTADDTAAVEITEASCFNRVQRFGGTHRNIRVKAQVKPGLTGTLRGDAVES